MKSRMRGCFVAFLAVFAASLFAEEPSKSLSLYQQERDSKDANARLLFAREIVDKSSDAAVVHEAVLDLVKYSTDEKENRIALECIDAALRRVFSDNDAYREMTFAKGKLLARMGESEAADELFREAIQKHWKNASLRYGESLVENGFWEQACILEFERIAGLPDYQDDRGEDESLEFFLALLRKMKHAQPDQSAVTRIYEKIQRVRKEDPCCEIARALCLAEDKNVEESITVLQNIDAILAKYRFPTVKILRPSIEYQSHREYRNIPLYIASILTKAGDSRAANEAFSEYMERNAGKDEKIIKSAIRIVFDLDLEWQDRKNKVEFTSFLIESPWFKDASVQQRIGDNNLSIIYDHLQMGLASSERWEESAKVCQYVMEHYLHTMGGQNCLQCYAMYVGWRDNNEAESIRLLQKSLTIGKNDMVAVNVLVIFTERAMKKGNYEEALSHIQQALDYVSPYEKGWKADRRKQIVNLQKEITARLESE